MTSSVLLWLHLLHLLVVTWRTCAVEMNGAGASFPYDVYSAWMPAYKAYRRSFRHVAMKYDSIGSGAGKARIKGYTGPPVAYAGSDSLLKEEEYENHPDLQMLPSLAGAIVLAFNIPGVKELYLSMAHVVGIYNGSINHWNHSSLLELNPRLATLDQRILVAARRDKSGTTELFTAALSAVDADWKTKYGSFSAGLKEDDTPHVWDGNVVTLYGETNRGVSGMVLSTKYSIGYLVHSDAVTAKLFYATLVNAAGNRVEATAESVQNAMDDFADSFSPRMTRSLANPTGDFSYPISGYTYLILHMSSMTDCVQATELVRYIEWFYTDPIARVECENLYMVPLSPKVYQAVVSRVLKQVTCKGANVYGMVQADRQREHLSLQTWRTPVYVACPIIAVLMLILTLYLVRDQIRTNRALLKDEWRIHPEAISFSDTPERPTGSRSSVFKGRAKVYPSMISLDSTVTTLPTCMEGKRVGKTKTGRVLLTELPVLTGSVTLSMKRALLRFRDHVTHENLTRFYGLYLDNATGMYCSVTQFCSRGDLQMLLHGTRYSLDNNLKYALCMGVARGLAYLHGQRLVHASLTSSHIYLDDTWSVRIGGWEMNAVAGLRKKSGVCLDMQVDEWTRPEFWTAPEVLSQRSLPSMPADVYSLAIVMQEIFSRDMPYAEQSAFMSPSETLTKVVCESLRPHFTPDTPLDAREIMQSAWEMDPLARPSIKHVVAAIRKACPKTRSLMDSMLDSLMLYVAQLEDASRLTHGMLGDKPVSSEQRSGTTARELGTSLEAKWQYRLSTLPPAMARLLAHTDVMTPRLLDSASVLVVSIAQIDKLIQVSTPQEVMDFLSDVMQSVVTLLDSRYQNVLLAEVCNGSYTMGVGLTQCVTDHLKTAACLALDLLAMADTFTIRHRREDRLSLRIGLGTGSALVGVSGQGFTQFSVLGEVLWRAQNMCDTGLPRAIHVNDATHTALAALKYFTCVERKQPAMDKDDHRSSVARTYWLITHRNITQTYNPESLSNSSVCFTGSRRTTSSSSSSSPEERKYREPL